MIVTHLFQVLGFVAMEPPSSLDARALKAEKAKVYDGLRLWAISEPLLRSPPPVQPYAPGSWGPELATSRLVAPYRWHLPGEAPAGGEGR